MTSIDKIAENIKKQLEELEIQEKIREEVYRIGTDKWKASREGGAYHNSLIELKDLIYSLKKNVEFLEDFVEEYLS